MKFIINFLLVKLNCFESYSSQNDERFLCFEIESKRRNISLARHQTTFSLATLPERKFTLASLQHSVNKMGSS